MPEQTATSRKQFTITRVFAAPRELVWRAWIDPEEVAFWWHPRDVVTPRESIEIDARPGGRYRYTMIAADGTEYPTGGVYREITPPERLVLTWGSPDEPDDSASVITVELAVHGDDGDETRMTFHLQGIDGVPGDDNVYDGWASAFDMLDERIDMRDHLEPEAL